MRVLITGGCGFLGTNMAAALFSRGDAVRVVDNLSRAGTELNLAWLEREFKRRDEGALEVVRADVSEPAAVVEAVDGCDVVVHLAAQVAVTTSVQDPRLDFDVNALGTLNVLEAARLSPRQPPVLFASTNKVYGAMDDVPVVEDGGQYRSPGLPQGTPEDRPLDFHSPYGCSKGSADQYVRDYARIYELPTVVFRTSCLYGPHQFGNEDQGWVAHFVRAALEDRSITIYGDGKQVRDLLYVDDAVAAYLTAIEQMDSVAGEVFNLGGGPSNTASLLELLEQLEAVLGKPVERSFDSWRPGDQPVYISDIRKLTRELGWRPTLGVEQGLRSLTEWMASPQAGMSQPN